MKKECKNYNFSLFLIYLLATLPYISSIKLKAKMKANSKSKDPIEDLSNEYYSSLINKPTQKNVDFNIFEDLKSMNPENSLMTNNKPLNPLQNFSYDHFFPEYLDYQKNYLDNLIHKNYKLDEYDRIRNDRDLNYLNLDKINVNEKISSGETKNNHEISFLKKNENENKIYPMSRENIPANFISPQIDYSNMKFSLNELNKINKRKIPSYKNTQNISSPIKIVPRVINSINKYNITNSNNLDNLNKNLQMTDTNEIDYSSKAKAIENMIEKLKHNKRQDKKEKFLYVSNSDIENMLKNMNKIEKSLIKRQSEISKNSFRSIKNFDLIINSLKNDIRDNKLRNHLF